MAWNQIDEYKKILKQETGTVFKDWGGRLPVALAYPNTYYVGMSSVGLQLIYRIFNDDPEVVCERVFWEKDGANRRLVSLESQRPMDDFALWAFTISYEMDYFNLVQMLRQAGIPELAQDRDESYPLLLAGGPALSMNPEPIAPFFDAIVIGEGEDVIPQIVEIIARTQGDARDGVLRELTKLEGVYVPLLHTPDSRNSDFKPIKRLWVKDLREHPTQSSLYTPNTEFGDLHLMEIARGCGRGCRFCLAGYVYRPPREVDAETLLSWARQGLGQRQKLGLISAAVSDHTEIDALAVELRKLGAKISVSSMRTDPISVPLVKAMAESGTQTLTIAPEAGSQRLRNVINKTQTVDDMLEAVELAESLKFPQLKLYFMVGHPTETDEDIQALIDFALDVRKRFKRRLALNTTPYVPKAHTPFQWKAMTPAKLLERRQDLVKRALAKHAIAVRADSCSWAEVQAVLSRGDRRIAQVLMKLAGMSVPNFHKALADCGLSAADYLSERSQGSPLPWDIVESNVSANYFAWELRLAEQNETGHACPPDSAGCLTCQACTPEWAFRHTGGVPMKKEGTYTSTGKLVISPIPLLV